MFFNFWTQKKKKKDKIVTYLLPFQSPWLLKYLILSSFRSKGVLSFTDWSGNNILLEKTCTFKGLLKIMVLHWCKDMCPWFCAVCTEAGIFSHKAAKGYRAAQTYAKILKFSNLYLHSWIKLVSSGIDTAYLSEISNNLRRLLAIPLKNNNKSLFVRTKLNWDVVLTNSISLLFVS